MGSGNSGDIFFVKNKVGTFGKEACFNINISIGSILSIIQLLVVIL